MILAGGCEIRNSAHGPIETLFRLFSGIGSEVQAAAVEVDRVGEVLLVPESARRVLHPLNLGIDRLAGSVGYSVLPIRDDVLEAALQHSPHSDHGFQSAAHRPMVPPAKVLSGRPLI